MREVFEGERPREEIDVRMEEKERDWKREVRILAVVVWCVGRCGRWDEVVLRS